MRTAPFLKFSSVKKAHAVYTGDIMEKTKKLYDNEPYSTTFEASVIGLQLPKEGRLASVVLDATLFFPEEGGQTPDTGVLAGFPVVDVQIDSDGVITHLVDVSSAQTEGSGAAPCGILAPGAAVHGQINWEHRFSNMQNHSGEHILSGLLHRLFGYENVGFRLSDHTVTLDTAGPLSEKDLILLEQRANAVVWSNVPIHCEYPAAEVLAALDYRSKKAIDGPVRIVTIEGVDACACCAPHVSQTGEIGLIKILSAEKNRNATRLTFLCGSRALLEMQRRQEELTRASRLMNEPVETVSSGVRKRLDEIYALKGALYQKELQYIQAKLSTLSAMEDSSGDLYLFETDLSPKAQRELMNGLCGQGRRYAGVFVGSEENSWKYLIGSRGSDARIPGALLREKLQARGGGKADMVQGSLTASEAEIRQVLGECG